MSAASSSLMVPFSVDDKNYHRFADYYLRQSMMKFRLHQISSLKIIALLLATASSVHSQQPRFKVAAFYSTKGEMDHINFAKDALYFFDLVASQQNFTFDATTDWTTLNDDYVANYDVIIWLNDFPKNDEQRAALSPTSRNHNKGFRVVSSD